MREEFKNERFRAGLEVRRAVVGESYVEKSLAAADDVSAPLQKLITEWCWGEVWTRSTLDRRARSILNLGMLMALNRQNELRLHILGAINNGVTQEELVEIVLQGAVYCGVPASLDAMKALQSVLTQLEAKETA